MGRSMRRWILALIALVAIAAATFAATPHASAAAPNPQAPACTYYAWYLVRGPNLSPTIGGASVKAWLYARKDIYDGTYCGYVYAAVDYSMDGSQCHEFGAAIYKKNSGQQVWRLTPTLCSAQSGSIQSPFYHTVTSGCYEGQGWVDSVYYDSVTTSCWNV